MHGIEGRYAAALYTSAMKQKKLDVIEKDIQSFKKVLETNEKFKVNIFLRVIIFAFSKIC